MKKNASIDKLKAYAGWFHGLKNNFQHFEWIYKIRWCLPTTVFELIAFHLSMNVL